MSGLHDDRWVRGLEGRGFTAEAAQSRADLFVDCAEAQGRPDPASLRAWWVPGRIEVLGKHTDYAGGRSLLCATDLGISLVVRPRTDASVTIVDARSGESERFSISPDLETTTGDWTNYPRTAARRLARNFGSLKGADIGFKSDLPLAAGMSSSSALIVAFSILFLEINHLDRRQAYSDNIGSLESLAGYLGTVENGQTFGDLEGDAGVGTFGGSEDHTAILCSSSSHLKQYAFCPVRHEHTVRFPDSHVFVIANSGVIAEKTGAALEDYNRATRLAAATTEALSRGTGESFGHLAEAIELVSPETCRALLDKGSGEFSGADCLNRFDQFLVESETLIPQASLALAGDDLVGFGACVTDSQRNGAKLLGNQIEQTVWLCDTAGEMGALTASAFGAGFGGSVYAIVKREQAQAFSENWLAAYRYRFPGQSDGAACRITQPGPAVFELEVG